MGKTITIPRTNNNDDDQDTPVGFNCEVTLSFRLDGDFERDAGGDSFSSPLPSGPVSAGDHGPFKSPSTNVEVWWRFSSAGLKTQHGIIEVERSGDCKTDDDNSRRAAS